MKIKTLKDLSTFLLSALILVLLFSSCVSDASGKADDYDPNRLIFLLIGQSNMEGAPKPEAQDRMDDPRVTVLAYRTSASLGRVYNQWYKATPPLHNPGLGLGPGDYFAKTLIEELPEGYSIGLVPCGIAGVDMDFFCKGVISNRRNEFMIPPDDSWDGAYEWVIERAKIAQSHGTLAGILFHQGESDAGQMVWLDKVKEMTNDLRTDLEMPDAPLLVGELLYGGPCSGHNRVISYIPQRIDNAYVISAEGLAGQDPFHFNLEAQRELGRRYAEKMLEVLELPELVSEEE